MHASRCADVPPPTADRNFQSEGVSTPCCEDACGFVRAVRWRFSSSSSLLLETFLSRGILFLRFDYQVIRTETGTVSTEMRDVLSSDFRESVRRRRFAESIGEMGEFEVRCQRGRERSSFRAFAVPDNFGEMSKRQRRIDEVMVFRIEVLLREWAVAEVDDRPLLAPGVGTFPLDHLTAESRMYERISL